MVSPLANVIDHSDDAGDAAALRAALQAAAAKDLLFARLDDAVRPLSQPEEITSTAARALGEHLVVERCAYAFVEADQDTFLLTGNYTNGVDSIVGRYRFRQFSQACLDHMRAGEPWVVVDSLTDPRIDALDREAYQRTQIRSVVCVPILKSGRFVAAMAVHMSRPRTWSAAEVVLTLQVASRCWESIERARVERERQALLEAAEAANRAKDEFLAMLGHELRNPLAPIRTALDLMNLRDEPSTSRERTIIERQLKHLTRLVDDLLDVSRIARGKIELRCELVELHAVVTRAIEMAGPLFEQRSQVVTLHVESGLVIEADVERMTQVVSNLLTNASKYTPAGGTIALSGTAEADEVVLRVRDDGVGMSAEVLPLVFDPFMQAGQSLDRARGGLGLGLSIVKSLVERHGGTVSAHSEGPNLGSELKVRLPKARSSGEIRLGASATGPSRAGWAGRSVLVVDDNVDAAEMLGALLRKCGARVELAHDGNAALELAASHRFDVALLDIGLPHIDGYQLVARLRTLPTQAGAYFVALTGYGQPSDRERALQSGFHEHLIKPVDMALLGRIMAHAPVTQTMS